MSDDVYNKKTRNWVKGIFALNTTRKALRGCIHEKLERFIRGFTNEEETHLEQFFQCLKTNDVQQLKKLKSLRKTKERNRSKRLQKKQLTCEHYVCETLMRRFVEKHEDRQILSDCYEWIVTAAQTSSPTSARAQHTNIHETIWKVTALYMIVDEGDDVKRYQSLDALDISKVIKVMTSCTLFVPDGSKELYDKVRGWRNECMHSPDNHIGDDDIKDLILHSKELLGCLGISSAGYYTTAMQDLQKYEDNDIYIGFGSVEVKDLLIKVGSAKEIAAKLQEDNWNEKHIKEIKQIQDILEEICRTGMPSMVYEPKKYKAVVEELMGKQMEAIDSDMSECDKQSEMYDKLQQRRKLIKKKRQELSREIENVDGMAQLEKRAQHLKEVNEKLEPKELSRETENEEGTAQLEKRAQHLKEADEKFEPEKLPSQSENEEGLTHQELSEEITWSDRLSDDEQNVSRERKQSGSDAFTTEFEYHRKGRDEPEFESSKASKVPARNGQPSPKPKVSTKRQTSIPETSRQKDERATSPKMSSQENLEEESPSADKSGWSPNDLEVFQRPLCLVSADESNTLTIETETIQQIQQIDWPMVIVSVVGFYRTGKSFLMNCLAGSTTGFPLGHTTTKKTEGIWAWCKIHPRMSNTVLLLLDTEGFGDENDDTSHENKILTLATLLSNCLVCNMRGPLDKDLTYPLIPFLYNYTRKMAKNIRYRRNASEDNKSLGLILPDFVLCLRDFSLELSKGGKLITEDEYLEQSCAEQEGKADKFNKPRKCIRTHFPVRKCFTMPKPVERKDRLKELDRLQFNDLSDEFKEAINLFQSFVYSKKPKQLLTSNPVNGQMFAILTIHYIQTIRYGAGPDVDYAFRAVAKTELTRIGQEAVEIFSTQMQKVALPVTAVQLEKHYAKAQQAALAHLRKTVVHDNDIYLYYMADAQWEMDNIWNNMNKDNSKQVRNMCEAMLQEAYTKVLKGKIDIYKVLVAGGYSQFQHDIQMLKEDYVSTFRDFENHQIFWTWHGFMKTLQEAVSEIIKSDEALSQKEKEDERKRNEEQIEKIWKDQQDSQKEALEKQEKHFDEFRKECVKQTQENEIKYEALVAERLEKEEAEKEIARYKEEAG